MKPQWLVAPPIALVHRANTEETTMPEIENDENKNLIDDHEEATTGMYEVDNFDFERAAMLMSVLEKCATIGVKATSVAGLAAAALEEMNQEAKDIAKRRAEAFKELERKRDEALAAQAREQAERKLAEDEEAAEQKAQRAKAIPNPAIASTGTQSLGPVPSKTNDVARDNSRRL